MPIIHRLSKKPSNSHCEQTYRLAVEELTNLHMFAIPPSNPLYAFYQNGLAVEIAAYLDRIGKYEHAPSGAVLAFEDDSCSTVIGFVIYLPVPSHPEACGITYMAVHPGNRGQGIAKEMMKSVIDCHPHVGLTCPVEKVGFYEGLGFMPLGVRKTQILMNTRSHTCPGKMAIEDEKFIYESREMNMFKAHLTAKHGPKAMRDAHSRLIKQIDRLSRKADEYWASLNRESTLGK